MAWGAKIIITTRPGIMAKSLRPLCNRQLPGRIDDKSGESDRDSNQISQHALPTYTISS